MSKLSTLSFAVLVRIICGQGAFDKLSSVTDLVQVLSPEHCKSALKNILISLPLRLHFCYSAHSVFVEFHFGEVVMTFTKALIAKKIADDCGFMKGEAVEILENCSKS